MIVITVLIVILRQQVQQTVLSCALWRVFRKNSDILHCIFLHMAFWKRSSEKNGYMSEADGKKEEKHSGYRYSGLFYSCIFNYKVLNLKCIAGRQIAASFIFLLYLRMCQ